MRHWKAILTLAAAAGLAVPAEASNDVFIPVAYTEHVVVVLKVPPGRPQRHSIGRVTELSYYQEPSFEFEGVPIQLTETEFEIDCRNFQKRRLHAAAYRDIDEYVGEESYSEDWAPIAAGTHFADMHRIVCDGLGPIDKVYSNLTAAVGAHRKLVRDALGG
jgi:hypothetical protein